MQTAIDRFFSKLSLVKFADGHMGTAFINFLHYGIYPNHDNRFWYDNNSYEWAIVDYFSHAMAVPVNELKFPEEIANDLNFDNADSIDDLKLAFYKIAKLVQLIHNTNSVSKEISDFIIKNNMKIDNFHDLSLIDSTLVKRYLNKDIDTVYYPIIKTHTGLSVINQTNFTKLINQFNWNKKYVCIFPPDKYWIPIVLVLYKKILYTKFNNLPTNYNYTFEEIEKIKQGNWSKTLMRRKYMLYDIDDSYIPVNIYELVFGDYLKELDRIGYTQPLNAKQISVINAMRETSRLILAKFNMDYENGIAGYELNKLREFIIKHTS
jgi:hypothetical protein